MLETLPLFIVMLASAGYLFCNHCIRTSYGLAREDGQRFYIKTIAWGVPFSIVCVLAYWVLFSIPNWLNVDPIFFVPQDIALVLTCLAIPVFSYLAAHLYNLLSTKLHKDQLFEQAMLANDFDAILLQAMNWNEPIAISMESRKIYVGLIYTTVTPGDGKNNYITILPLLSGHRAIKDLKFNIAARYDVVIDLLRDASSKEDKEELLRLADNIQNYTMALPKSKIVSLHLFNQDLHEAVVDQYGSGDAPIKF